MKPKHLQEILEASLATFDEMSDEVASKAFECAVKSTLGWEEVEGLETIINEQHYYADPKLPIKRRLRRLLDVIDDVRSQR
jgi:hypothetical protein